MTPQPLPQNDGMLYAALDGAVFEDLPSDLSTLDCAPQSLYLGAVDPAVAAVGPWLVTLGARGDRSKALTWVQEQAARRPCGIVIRSRTTGVVLRRHLRSLNLVQVPKTGTVLFRWYDPRILPAVLHVLTPPQRTRFYGPVDAFSVIERSGHEVELALRPLPDSVPERGLLCFDADQMARLEELLQAEMLPLEILRFLRGSLASKVATLSDADLLERIRLGMARARSWGLESSDAIVWFVRRMFVISPSFDRLPAIKRVLADPSLNEAGKIDRLRAPENALLWGKAAMLSHRWE